MAVLAFHLITVAGMLSYFTLGPRSQTWFYAACCTLGLGCGYWAVFATTAAEQFGTNVRATAATTAPNLVRWSAAATAGLWVWLEGLFGRTGAGPWHAAAVAAAVVMVVGMVALLGLRETYGIDLDYEER